MPAREHETREATQTKNDESSNHFLLGMVIGGAVGAFAALLLAPKAGKDLRKTLKNSPLMERTASLREEVVTKGSDWISKASTLSEGFVQQSSDLINRTTKNSSLTSNDEETHYIPLGTATEKNDSEKKAVDQDDIRRKLEEAKKALEEEENKVKH